MKMKKRIKIIISVVVLIILSILVIKHCTKDTWEEAKTNHIKCINKKMMESGLKDKDKCNDDFFNQIVDSCKR